MKIQTTLDGSLTVYSERFSQTYHSVFGAKQESNRVFIELGFDFVSDKFEKINLLEFGFGTGLNAVLTAKAAEDKNILVSYEGIEAFPLPREILHKLPSKLLEMQLLEWNYKYKINSYFLFKKILSRFEDFKAIQKYHLIYYDAFSPDRQPELWTKDIFEKVINMMEGGGVLTTYCSKSLVQRNLQEVGFIVEKHLGPPHKREVIRAIKPN